MSKSQRSWVSFTALQALHWELYINELYFFLTLYKDSPTQLPVFGNRDTCPHTAGVGFEYLTLLPAPCGHKRIFKMRSRNAQTYIPTDFKNVYVMCSPTWVHVHHVLSEAKRGAQTPGTGDSGCLPQQPALPATEPWLQPYLCISYLCSILISTGLRPFRNLEFFNISLPFNQLFQYKILGKPHIYNVDLKMLCNVKYEDLILP